MGYFKNMSIDRIAEKGPPTRLEGLASSGGIDTRGTFVTPIPAAEPAARYTPSVPNGSNAIGYDSTGRVTVVTSARIGSVSTASFQSAEPMPPLKKQAVALRNGQ